jgi:hypothetical protein
LDRRTGIGKLNRPFQARGKINLARKCLLKGYDPPATGKLFFFEEKNQKTFVRFGGIEFTHLGAVRRAICKSFLLLFFKKEVLSALPAAPGGGGQAAGRVLPCARRA